MPRLRMRFVSDDATTDHLIHLLLLTDGVSRVAQTEGMLPRGGGPSNGSGQVGTPARETREFEIDVPDANVARRVRSLSESLALVTGAGLELDVHEDDAF